MSLTFHCNGLLYPTPWVYLKGEPLPTRVIGRPPGSIPCTKCLHGSKHGLGGSVGQNNWYDPPAAKQRLRGVVVPVPQKQKSIYSPCTNRDWEARHPPPPRPNKVCSPLPCFCSSSWVLTVADLFFFCYERNFMSLSDKNDAYVPLPQDTSMTY